MKKFVSLLLVLCMVLSLSVTAFAEKKCDCGHSPVIYLPGMGETIYDYTDETTPVRIYEPSSQSVKEAMPDLIIAVFGLLGNMYRVFANHAVKAAYIMLGRLICDQNGVPLYDTGVAVRPLPTKDLHNQFRDGMGDYVYYYDWRLDPMDTAKSLHEFTERVKQVTGHDKISFACHSMGNTVMASYLYLYGDEDVDRIACVSPAYQGLSVIGSLLAGEVGVGDKDEQIELLALSMLKDDEQGTKLKKVVKICYKTRILRAICHLLQRTLKWEFNRVYDMALREMFAHMRGVWAFVPDEYYEKAKTFSFGDDKSYNDLIAKIDDYHYNVQCQVPALLQKAMDDGIEVMIISGYGMSSIPLAKIHTTQADFVIDTKYMSIGAVCADYGKTLPADYKQAKDDGHNHLSPDRLVDASTCAFPEITWFIRDQMHFDSPRECASMVQWFMRYNGQPTIADDAAHPQFMVRNANGSITPLAD